jgi:3-phenylpropionate/trans-cinnamate dioxygenase ferredoxin reductase component
MMGRRIIIVGGGPAGVGAALAARQQDASADIMLIDHEAGEPYEKPPLSKAVLTGKAMPQDAPIAGPKGVAGANVVRKTARIAQLDRAAKLAITADAEPIAYDALVLATGARNRILPMFPADQPGIYYVRTADEALALKAHLNVAKSLLLIGGGVVGLEIAASAAELGIKVTVVEIAPRILARVCDEETAAIIHRRHRDFGVDIRANTVCTGLQALPDGKRAVVTKAGETLSADIIVVGAGAMPDDALASSAGLAVQDGILVDDHGRTSDPAIFAAGDCARFPGPSGPVRLENWRHAQEHGALAGRNAAGGDAAYNPVPSFWSEQYDLYIQGMGWPIAQPGARVRRKISDKASVLFELDGANIAYAVGINAQRDIATIRRLIERKIAVDASELADPAKPLNALLKPKS